MATAETAPNGQRLPLTPRESDVLAFIVDRLDAGHSAPSVREISIGIGLNVRSTHAQYYLGQLERKHYITRQAGLARSIVVVDSEGQTLLSARVPSSSKRPADPLTDCHEALGQLRDALDRIDATHGKVAREKMAARVRAIL